MARTLISACVQSWAILLILVAYLPAEPLGGVIVPPGGFGDGVTVVENGGVYRLDVHASAYGDQLPPDDRGLFRFTLFTTQNCGACELLKRDLERDQNLRSLMAWGALQIVDASQPSQADRVRAWKVGNAFPVLYCSPPAGHSRFPYYIVFRQVGYDGDARTLAERIYAALQKFYERYPATANDNGMAACPDGTCPTVTPSPMPVQPTIPVTPELPALIPPANVTDAASTSVTQIVAWVAGGLCLTFAIILLFGGAIVAGYFWAKRQAKAKETK